MGAQVISNYYIFFGNAESIPNFWFNFEAKIANSNGVFMWLVLSKPFTYIVGSDPHTMQREQLLLLDLNSKGKICNPDTLVRGPNSQLIGGGSKTEPRKFSYRAHDITHHAAHLCVYIFFFSSRLKF